MKKKTIAIDKIIYVVNLPKGLTCHMSEKEEKSYSCDGKTKMMDNGSQGSQESKCKGKKISGLFQKDEYDFKI